MFLKKTEDIFSELQNTNDFACVSKLEVKIKMGEL